MWASDMSIPNRNSYLDNVLDEMQKHWPDNKTVDIACHGHSVPAGYFATPYVNTFGSCIRIFYIRN